MILLSRALRLSPHSNRPPKTGHVPRRAKPWELEDSPA